MRLLALLLLCLLVASASAAAPEADFAANVTEGVAPLTVQLTDMSTNAPTEWSWSIHGPDSTTDFADRNLVVTLTDPYIYSIVLRATNADGTDTETKIGYIAVRGQPAAGFTADPACGISPLTVQFTDESAGVPIAWAWTFGDGATSTEQHPSHTYADAGVYSVGLNASNDVGFDTETKTDFIGSGVAAPVAVFAANATSGDAPLAVQFTESSTGDGLTDWYWDFGDGENSTERNPVHTYADVGVYEVDLRVDNAYMHNWEEKEDYIEVGGEPVADAVVAAFSANATTGTPPLTVQFTDASTGDATAWSWDFGDGSPFSTLQHPVHTYANVGQYIVSLNASDVNVSDTETKVDYITVTTGEVSPTADFSANMTSGTDPLVVQFTDQSTDAPTAWDWDFNNDGTIDSTEQNPVTVYMGAGTYTVVLNASNGAGYDTETKVGYITVTTAPVTPVADFSANVTSGDAPLTVAFTDQSSNAPTAWAWDLNGDGTIDSTEQDPVCEYPSVGFYTVVLNASNGAGYDTETKVGYIAVTALVTTAPVTTAPTTSTTPAQFALLKETHGTTWIQWTWQNAPPGENDTLVAQFDGIEVWNATANTTLVPVMHYAGDLNPNEYHVFSLRMVNNTTGTPTVTTSTLGSTTAQGSEYFYLLFVVVIALALVGAWSSSVNRYMAAVLLMFAFLIAAYLAVGLTATNASFSVIAIMAAVVTGLGMIFVLYDIVKSHVSWENDEY